ncbi:DUF3617 domain-containing protein [Erythrobacteraceae bacterium CFH 75059]|uniref:DUF3617 domain-containing protein n=1 Tax=Qipengyuania thermophila TaxID=2509361 RepID=UPI00101FC737|nr:DUF3617 domain-containing protein [Qipengyuania thermophila]TCD06368.1 DUF3617 domain-containing protein [Erythrobacteraceae bacterium CFH 75059]
MKTPAAAIVALLLTACGSADPAPEGRSAGSEAALQGQAEARPLPGQYRAQLTLVDASLPDAPPGAVEMMRQMMGARTHVYCLTPEEAQQSFAEMARRSQEGNCTTDSYEARGEQFRAALTCRSEAGVVRITMNGSGGPTRSDMTLAMTGALGGRGDASMTMRLQNERIGDCPG